MNQLSYFDHLKTPRTKRGRSTQAKILKAAEVEFGERGFHEASITGITQRARVALGTFYVYFASKEELFRALVIYMGKVTRAVVSSKVADAPDRLTAERLGIEAFIELTRSHKHNYRIINEAQFVAEDAYREYYRLFAQAYQENLIAAASDGEIRSGNEEERAWALIGMNVFLGMRYALWDDTRSAAEIAEAVGDMIAYGLAIEGKPK